jgi:hypothetical protein
MSPIHPARSFPLKIDANSLSANPLPSAAHAKAAHATQPAIMFFVQVMVFMFS